MFGNSPRVFDRETERFLLVDPPWVTKLRFGDPLAKLVQNSTLRSLFRTGVVVWGHIVQANNELFEPAPSRESYTYDRPGELLFSRQSTSSSPAKLEWIASELAGLRSTPNLGSELQSWADYLDAETTRVVGRCVPMDLAGSRDSYVSTSLFRRAHLPDGVLRQPLMPVVVASKSPFFAMPLPHPYWPKSLLDWWSTGG
ncbi:hypothetical protein CA85_26980 [Allorhodopirellula solitaria]|uniref:Uncharacterized protein n=1 Tax=Allorhodopirellula solitaria TaxID=2527987 RepID=A0A5C5XVQ3_9BACT|nr:hypothetical protein CA85_26980 [Allorhodopirellula solitaria]